jgi:zinc-ribbon domain
VRLESLIVGVLILGFGILLVSTNGNLAGVSLPGLIGLPTCNGGTNSTCGGVAGFGGYSIGTVVSLFGLGLIANGLRAPSSPRGMGGSGAPSLPPEMAATLLAAQQQMMASARAIQAASGSGAAAGLRYCPSCGSANQSASQFCHRCGKPLPTPEPPPKQTPPSTPPSSPPVPPPTSPPSPPPTTRPRSRWGWGHDKR